MDNSLPTPPKFVLQTQSRLQWTWDRGGAGQHLLADGQAGRSCHARTCDLSPGSLRQEKVSAIRCRRSWRVDCGGVASKAVLPFFSSSSSFILLLLLLAACVTFCCGGATGRAGYGGSVDQPKPSRCFFSLLCVRRRRILRTRRCHKSC